jgi:hypothetical protein
VFVLLAIGLPFLAVYLLSPARWWAIIPAGVLLTSAVIAAASLLPGFYTIDENLISAFALAAFAGVMVLVWLRHHQDWAKYIAALAGIATVAELLGSEPHSYGALVVIFLGIFLLARGLRPLPAGLRRES